MKKLVSVLLVFTMVFSLAACSNKVNYTPKEVDAMVESGEIGTIQGFYSVKNASDGEGDFYVQFNSAMEEVFDFYSDDGTLVKFYGDAVVYDKAGNIVPRTEIAYGQGLIIAFDGTASDTNPPTIKAYKITLA